MPLRLKSLELHGYKTFAARTRFEFASGITAIVGPNGAGKSNIADALRWVLGEQSYSLLRGKKTEDMIFSGSEHRPRAGMASAEIVFDNTTNWLPVDFADVAIARRAYRDGHNEYVLNGQHVRLRDMNELLAAAGLSERTYTIVGQGLVDASLALKADERRRLFEEAAGVGLYRVRREESLKRLENTQRNLERVQDIMSELEPRLKSLERQARRANEYAAAQADLRSVLREWYGYHWHKTQQELVEAQASVRGQQKKAEAARDDFDKAQANYSQFRGRLSQLRGELNTWRRETSELHQEREAASRGLAVLEERHRTQAASQAALLAEQQIATGAEELGHARLAEAEQELLRARAEFDEAGEQLAVAQQALRTRQEGRAAVEAELQAAREKVAGLGAQKAETQARVDASVSRLESLAAGTASLRQSIRAVEAEVHEAEKVHTEAIGRLKQTAARLQEMLDRQVALRNKVGQKEERRRAALDERTNVQSRYSRAQAQLEIVEQAEHSFSGYADGARFLLDAARQSRLSARGALSAVLDLPAELEIAIAAALGDAVDTVLLDASQVESALNLLETEDAGRAALLSLDGPRGNSLNSPNDEELLGIASELVSVPAELRAALDVLLGNTLVVRTRAAARRLLAAIPAHGRIVTLRGEVFRGDGLITAGKVTSASTLSRPRQKRELTTSLSEFTAHLKTLDATVEESSRQLQMANAELSAHEHEFEIARQLGQESQASEQKTALDLERQQRMLEWHRSRLADLLLEISGAEDDQGQLVVLAAQSDIQAAAARDEVRRLSSQLDQLSLDEAQEQAAYWVIRVAVTEQAVTSLEERKADRRQGLDGLAEEMRGLQARLAEADKELHALEEEKAVLLEGERDLQRRIEALQQKIGPAESELEAAEKRELNLAETETAVQRSASSVERSLAQFEIDLVRREEALDSLRKRIMDDFGLVAFEYAADVEGPVPLPFEGLVEELPLVMQLDPDLESRLSQRRARLRRLGLINPEAQNEYSAEAERYSFMTAQIQDLRQAGADLRQVIAEMDELTRQEFSRTYTSVDKQFREIFTRLFGGGSAHLSLTDPDNLIETGIEIEARLPGRREQGLSLLSGGERSLTAIALVFALLKVAPTPVCVMDEVDAMLDEANVGRFRDLLADLSQDTQFIIVTHNRNTVQAASLIYGVTMGRDSTSQIISLKLY